MRRASSMPPRRFYARFGRRSAPNNNNTTQQHVAATTRRHNTPRQHAATTGQVRQRARGLARDERLRLTHPARPRHRQRAHERGDLGEISPQDLGENLNEIFLPVISGMISTVISGVSPPAGRQPRPAARFSRVEHSHQRLRQVLAAAGDHGQSCGRIIRASRRLRSANNTRIIAE